MGPQPQPVAGRDGRSGRPDLVGGGVRKGRTNETITRTPTPPQAPHVEARTRGTRQPSRHPEQQDPHPRSAPPDAKAPSKWRAVRSKRVSTRPAREPKERSRRPQPSVVREHPQRRIIQIVELSGPYGEDEQRHEHGSEEDCHRDQENQCVHATLRELIAASLPRMSASTRAERTMTIRLESGIRMAATNGLTRPAAAADTARTL